MMFSLANIRSLVGILLIAFMHIESAYAQTPTTNPDATLYTKYDLFEHGEVLWSVCGKLEGTRGCYGGGKLGPFSKVGAMIEGLPSVNGNVVSRHVYVVDSGGPNAILYVYNKVETIEQPYFVDTNATLINKITLPLPSGKDSQIFMAANSRYLYIGSNLGDQAVVAVNKKSFSVSGFRVSSMPGSITSISANEYGFVSVTSQEKRAKEFTAHITFKEDGSLEGTGGGPMFVLDTMQGFTPPISYGVGHNEMNMNSKSVEKSK